MLTAYDKCIVAVVGLALTWLASHGIDLTASQGAIVQAVGSALSAGAVWLFPNK